MRTSARSGFGLPVPEIVACAVASAYYFLCRLLGNSI